VTIEKALQGREVVCAARHSNTGANDPQECDWPFCGCDPYADKVIAALQESGKLIHPSQASALERRRATSGVVEVDAEMPEDTPAAVHGCEGYKCFCCGSRPTTTHLRMRYRYTPLCDACWQKLQDSMARLRSNSKSRASKTEESDV
jgi:hypothetical protein